MDAESPLHGALVRSAEDLQPDVATALREVHGRARRRTTRRRAAVAGAVVGVVVAATLTAKLVAPAADGDESPVSPPREDSTFGVTVVHEASARSLGLRKLLSVAVSGDGRIYVTDSSQQVAELSADLEVTRTWGTSGAGDGQFRLVQGSIAVGPDGSVYLADTGNFRVQVFSPAGRFLRSLGEFGTGPGQFVWPFDVVLDAEGFLYVADDKEETLAKLSPSGRQIWRRGGIGETDRRLDGHAHLAMVDAQGRLVVTNDDQGVVMLIDRDGDVVDTLGDEGFTPGDVCDATVDTDGRYYLTACSAPWSLRVYDDAADLAFSVDDLGVVQAPRWAPDGTGYAVTSDGGIVALRTTD